MSSPDRYRPQFHFTPPQNWMNDPNGLLYHGGEYHLYYQHNPYGAAWGHMSWGHATSPNLVHWTRLPVAIAEQPDRGYTIFSGSAVVDAANTSGLGLAGRAPWVAVYTADYCDPRREDVHIAYSLDRGRTFTEYAGNPVIRVDEAKFGDPKVFWHAPSGRWIMVTILGAPQGRVVLYGSPNLRDWSRLSEFAAPAEAPGVWECPDLFPLALDGDPQREQWVLKVNHVSRAVGHATRYWVGAFDGTTFRPAFPALKVRPDDDGFYAEVTYNGIPAADGRRIMLGWLRQAPSEVRRWTGAQSIPRVLSLRSTPAGPQLCQAPVAELQYLRRHPHTMGELELSGSAPLFGDGAALGSEFELILTATPGESRALGVRLGCDDGRTVSVGYSAAGELYVEGAQPERLTVPWKPDVEPIKLHLFVDRTIIEVFAGQGERTISAVLEPDAVCTNAALYAEGGAARIQQVDAWRLDSALLTTNW